MTATWCDACARPVRASRPAPSPVGLVFRARRFLSRKPALCVSVDANGYTLLTSGTKTAVVPSADVSGLEQVELAWPNRQASCSASLLFNAYIAVQHKSVSEPWDSTAIWQYGLEHVAAEPSQLQAVVADATVNGFVGLIDTLELPATQKAWLRANAFLHTKDRARCIDTLISLPPDRFPDKVTVLATIWADVLSRPELHEQIHHQLTPFSDLIPIVGPMIVSLSGNDTTAATRLDAAATVTETLTVAGSARAEELVWEQSALRTPGIAGASRFPTSRAYLAHRALIDGTAPPDGLEVPDLNTLPAPLVDDLIDAGKLGASQVGRFSPAGVHPAYITARLDPSRCEDGDLRDLGHHFELGRRAYLAWDRKAQSEIVDDHVRSHFTALDALRDGKVADLTPEQFLQPFRGKVAAVLDAVQAGDIEKVEPWVLVDRTLWPAFASVTDPIEFRPSPSFAEAAPLFCEWMSLVRSRALLFAARWDDAIVAARESLAHAKDEALRDEALNLIACAHYQLGNDSQAITALEKALEGEYGEGLLANVGIVAAQLAPEAAARYLGKLVLETPSTAMKMAAARRAIAIWNVAGDTWAVPTGTGLPDAIRDPIRSLVVLDLPLEDFRQLVALMSEQDSAWLASSALTSSPHATSIEARYYCAKAISLEERIKVLAIATQQHLDKPWVVSERDGLTQAAVDLMLESNDGRVAVAHTAVQFLDQQVVLTSIQRLRLIAVTSLTIADGLREQGAEIADRLRDRALTMPALLNTLAPGTREQFDGLTRIGLNAVARNIGAYRIGRIGQLIDQSNEVAAIIRRTPSQELNRFRVRATLSNIRREGADCENRITVVKDHLSDAEHRRSMQSAVEDAQLLQRRCGEMGG